MRSARESPASALASSEAAAAVATGGSAEAAATNAAEERAPLLRTLLRSGAVGTFTGSLEKRAEGPTAAVPLRRPRRLALTHAAVNDNEHAAIVLAGSGCLPACARVKVNSADGWPSGHRYRVFTGWVSTHQVDTCRQLRLTNQTGAQTDKSEKGKKKKTFPHGLLPRLAPRHCVAQSRDAARRHSARRCDDASASARQERAAGHGTRGAVAVQGA